MRWPLAGASWKWPEFEIRGAAYIALSCWLVLLPIRLAAGALLAAAIHEAGHLAALWAFDVRVRRITIMAGGARIETEPMEAKTELTCALAGPMAGGVMLLFWRWMPNLALCALVQTVFNLLPIYPMDGGRALRAVGEIRKSSCKTHRFRVQ